MKRIIIAIAITACLVLSLCGCGNNNDTATTTAPPTTIAGDTTKTAAEDGSVTDQSESGNNGAAGELASDISEGLTDLSEKMR